MRKSVKLITGANGEIGQGLISKLYKQTRDNIITIDLSPISAKFSEKVYTSFTGNILDKNLLNQINSEYEISEIYHLAALLSTRAEFSPQMAHDVNVTGTLNLLNMAVDQSMSQGKPVKFFFPSSIAVYGLRNLENKIKNSIIDEDKFCNPETMYGCNKLYCENLGIYYSNYFQRLSDNYKNNLIDFRSIRFPGLISPNTIPSGGTSDYIPEMLHNAAKSKPYSCFVRESTTMPFMAMADAIDAILKLMLAPQKNLNRNVYNIASFNPTALEFKREIIKYYPNANINFCVNERRQSIVDSWPENIDDFAAKSDWNWKPNFNFEKTFSEYLIPQINILYK